MSEKSYFKQLKVKTDEEWPTITKAKADTLEQSEKLRSLISENHPPSNTSVVVFGSLAREEWTSGSDVDWTLLIDGPSDPKHFHATKTIVEMLEENKYIEPGPTAVFGAMSSSHELVHHVGGLEDTNQNLTRRALLLLESVSLSDPTTHERVIRSILQRYITDDPPAGTVGRYHVPLLLLNDIARYWRTMAVDYATKKWQRHNKGWALRNIKLRMSRKLLAVKGMLMCLLCHESFAGKSESDDPEEVELDLLIMCRGFAKLSALDILCKALHDHASEKTSKKTLNAYEDFLTVLDDEEQREELKNLRFEQLEEGLFGRMRDVSREFSNGIQELFFESNDELTRLTKKYGVF